MRHRLFRFAAGSTLTCLIAGCGLGRGVLAKFSPTDSADPTAQRAIAKIEPHELEGPRKTVPAGGLPSRAFGRQLADRTQSEPPHSPSNLHDSGRAITEQALSNDPVDRIQRVAFDDSIVPEPPIPGGATPHFANELQPLPEHASNATPIDVMGAPIVAQWRLADLESLALAQNPSIREASAAAQKVAGYYEQVGTRPNPVVGYNASQLADAGTDQHIAFVEQDFVTGDKLIRNQAVLGQEYQSQLWEVEARRFRVLTDVRRHFYEALAAQQRLQLATAFHEVAEKGARIAQLRVDAKEGSVPEVLQAEIQLSQVEIQKQQSQAAYRGAWNQLMAVVGQPSSEPGTLEGNLPGAAEPPDLDAITANVIASSPEMQAARARVCRARANVDRQEVQAIPNVGVMLAAGRDNGTGSSMFNAQVGMPLPIFNRNAGNVSAATAEVCRASQEVHRTELAIRSRLAATVQSFESANAAVQQYEQQILPRAKRTLTLTEEAYAAGEFDFLQVLIARRTYFESNLEAIAARSNLAQAGAYLDGMVLSGSLDGVADTSYDSGLRDQSLSGQ